MYSIPMRLLGTKIKVALIGLGGTGSAVCMMANYKVASYTKSGFRHRVKASEIQTEEL